jgi:hypothetical protein
MAKQKQTTVDSELTEEILQSEINGFYRVATCDGETTITHWCNGNQFSVASGLKSDKEIKEAISKHEKSL